MLTVLREKDFHQHMGDNILDLMTTRYMPDFIVAAASVELILTVHHVIQCDFVMVKPRLPRKGSNTCST